MRVLMIILIVIFTLHLSATIVNVPSEQPTIQEGINVTVDGDTVLVQPGTYVENINYNGKNITVASLFHTTQDTSYISQTIIDGNQNDSVVKFVNGENSDSILTGFTIKNGNAHSGGGINCYSSSPILENIVITNNSALYYGGGINLSGGGSPSLINVTISNNIVELYDGGGINLSGNSNLSLVNVTISNNIAESGKGGGLSYKFYSYPILRNVIIISNSASKGGGINSYNCSSSILENVTIANNTAVLGGGIYCLDNSSFNLVNCIFWYNAPQEIYFADDFGYRPNSITTSYSNIQGGEVGIVTNNNGIVNWLEGNINEDPLFLGIGEYPYSLFAYSPCIDAGIPDTTGLNLPEYDLAGNPRLFGTRIDMGAYEWQGTQVEDDELIPLVTRLNQNYPNPFNPATTIEFSIHNDSKVEITVFNIKGQKIKTLVQNLLTQGSHSIIWNGDDDKGKSVSSGVYLYKLNVNGKTEAVKKCLLLK